LFLLGLGGAFLPQSSARLREVADSLLGLQLRAPGWLFLLLLLPLFVLLGRDKLRRDTSRPWLTLALRLLGTSLLALALAEPFFNQTSRAITVLFVVDRSLSIPEELAADPAQPGVKIDRRAQRLVRWIN